MATGYFDNNGTTAVLPQVLQAMIPYYGAAFGNPSAIYRRGMDARAAVEAARESVARLLGCAASEIVFTSGGTESDNTAMFGLVEAGDHVVTLAIEHAAILNACRVLERRGVAVTRLRTGCDGRVDAEDVRRAVRSNTKLISVMTANNETGVLQPVEEIGRIAAEVGAWFHTDAVQAAGKIPIAVDRIGCHLLAISGHKINAPQGIGILFVRYGTPLKPLLYGGHQERGRRAGTENLPAIVGLGKACEAASAGLDDGTVARIRAWRDRFETAVVEGITDVEINGRNAPRVANTSSVAFKDVRGDALVVELDRRGIVASAGSACSAGSGEPSHVLTAMGFDAVRARSSVRFSFGKLNDESDVEDLIAVLPEAVRTLRDASPLSRRRKAESPMTKD